MVPLDSLIQPIWEVATDPVALISFDRNPSARKFVYVNPAFSALTGYSSAEAHGRPSTLLNGRKTSRTATQEWESAVILGKACRIALVNYRKDGSEYVVHTTIAPLVEPDGSAHFLIMVHTIMSLEGEVTLAEMASDPRAIIPLALPMPLKEIPAGYIPTHLVSHPELDALQTLWTELRGDRALPQRKDFELRTVSRWASHLSIATAMPTGRFQFRLFGTDLTRVYGQDLTGRFLDEMTPRDLWGVIIRHYQHVVNSMEPLFAPISIANGRWYSEVSRLLLPLAIEGQDSKVAFILGADYGRSI